MFSKILQVRSIWDDPAAVTSCCLRGYSGCRLLVHKVMGQVLKRKKMTSAASLLGYVKPHIRIYKYSDIHIYIYTYYTYIHIYIYTYIHIYIYTYIHIYKGGTQRQVLNWLSARAGKQRGPEYIAAPLAEGMKQDSYDTNLLYCIIFYLFNVYIYIYVYCYICVYVYMYICIYVYMYICIYVYMYICIYVYMYICIYVLYDIWLSFAHRSPFQTVGLPFASANFPKDCGAT